MCLSIYLSGSGVKNSVDTQNDDILACTFLCPIVSNKNIDSHH